VKGVFKWKRKRPLSGTPRPEYFIDERLARATPPKPLFCKSVSVAGCLPMFF
jgi:hypothetical protein